MAAAEGLVLVSAAVGWGTCSGNSLLGRNFSSILLLVPVLGNSAVSIHSSHRICGTSLPDFCSEEDFRINAQGESRPCWESIGFVEEEEQDSEEEAEEEFPTGDDEEEKQSIFEEQRNCAELPRDVPSLIFKKIAATETLTSAQFVCRTWQQLSHEPEIWRCIDMPDVDPDWMLNMKSVAMEAVDRSQGCLEEFYLGILGMMSSCSISLIGNFSDNSGDEEALAIAKAYAAANSASTNVNLDENLKRKCARIKVLRLPDDSFYDFHMDINIGELQEPPEEYDSDLGSFGFENDWYSAVSNEDYFGDLLF